MIQINQQISANIRKDQKADVPDKSNEAVNNWEEGTLLDYFAGQKVEEEKQNGEKTKGEFPTFGFDTHVISPKGVEIITKGEEVFYRTSTTAKIWKKTTLIDYFKDHLVINALPDTPEEQLPTVKLKTHAISPDEIEIVSYKDRFWRRKGESKNWETGYLKDYFINQTVEKGNFPVTYWDIHLFSPMGEELIIVGDNIWIKKVGGNNWQVKTLKEYFGDEFPLEKEIEEKNKVESEIDKKRYELVKEKVMGELRKFFRPELLNRFDEVVIFEPLKFVHMMAIVKLQLKGVGKLLEDQEIGFLYTQAAVKEIVRAGFDPIYGARPLRRAIQKLIENPISTMIIEGKVKPGDQILVDFDGENFVFNVEKVELVDASKIKKEKIKSFLCQSCAHRFQTETVENATTICPKCASNKVEEVMEDKEKEKSEEQNPKSEANLPVTDVKNSKSQNINIKNINFATA
ncbi:MAG: hypothetical protein ACK4FL_02355 [Microgenomates group bacterium]